MTSVANAPVSQALLPIIRYFCAAFLEPGSRGWRIAYQAAIGTWGEGRGLIIAHATQDFVAQVLSSRPVPLDYTDPLDINRRDGLTADEATLLKVISHMRADATAEARRAIAELTGGPVRAGVVRTGLIIANLFSAAPATRQRHPRPALCAVS
jgi:hypothetical protein